MARFRFDPHVQAGQVGATWWLWFAVVVVAAILLAAWLGAEPEIDVKRENRIQGV